jgi:hypothetical protein
MTTLPSLLRVAIVLSLLACALAAQPSIALRDIGPGRGKVFLGEGGLTTLPPFQVAAGSLGASLAWADLNDDGIDDLIVGAPSLTFFPVSANEDDSGHVYVIFGAADNGNPADPSDVDLVDDTCTTVINLAGSPGARFGTSVRAAGDLDGDGIEDVVIGAPGIEALGRTASGGAYVLWGATDLDDLPVTIGLPLCLIPVDNLLGAQVTLLAGADSFAAAGTSVDGNIDANGDGVSDVVIGAPLQSTGALSQNGTATVVYGSAGLKGQSIVDLAALGAGAATVVSGTQDFELLGSAVAALGAFDSTLPDGLGQDLAGGDDIAIGAPGFLGAGFFSGAVYVLRGRTAGTPAASYDSDDFGNGAGSAGLAWFGESTGDQFGSSVASAGDLIGFNGFVELVCGAPFHDALGRADAGSLYVIAGRLGATDPVGFDVDQIGSGALGLQIAGASAVGGVLGVSASPAGDFDVDGQPDLAVGFPGATVFSGALPLAQAGTVDVLDGGGLGIPAVSLIDMATDGLTLSLLRLNGEAPGSHAGSDLSSGDFNGDGFRDLAVGADGAPSDPDPLDFTGLAFSETGRAHVLFGPELRVADVTPTASHFLGPTVSLSIYNFDDATGLDIKVDGFSATLDLVTTGSLGTVVIQPPVPAVPGASVDISVDLPGLSVVLPDVLTYTALAIDSGPTPSTAVPGVVLTFSGQAFSSVGDMSVTIGGMNATILSVDPLAGDMTVTAPAGLPAFIDQDISIISSNGSVLLTDAIVYEPFVINDFTPTTGPQDAGVFDGSLPFPGQPDVPITFTMVTVAGTIPPETTVEFGGDALIWRAAEVVSMIGDQLIVNLPELYLFDETVVDVRVTTNDHVQLLDDAFTYMESDFLESFDLTDPACAESPRFLAAGELLASHTMLFIVEYPTNTTDLGILIEFAQPVTPITKTFWCGALNVEFSPLGASFFVTAPPGNSLSLPLTTDATLAGLVGVPIYLQVIARIVDGPSTVVSFSEVLSATVDD